MLQAVFHRPRQINFPTIDVPIFDHDDANALPGIATLTPEDPLAGLDDLAAQIAASGIRRVAGDVVIDDRLW